MSFTYKIRIALWLILGLITVSLLYFGIVPGGKISYSGVPGGDFFIKKLSPAERLDQGRIVGDPAYFSLKVPRRFERAQIILEYEKEGDLPIIELGILADKRGNYDLKPVENRMLDDLAWEKIPEGNLTLYQRDKKYGSIKEFLASPPASGEIAVYNHDFYPDYKMADYEPNKEPYIFDHPLRGPFKFFTYLKDEDLDFRFMVSDLNKNKESDTADVDIYRDGRLIHSQHLDDDGITGDSGRIKEDRKIGVKLVNLPEGVYKVELKAGDDIITKKIETNNKKMAFLNKIWLADNNKDNIRIYTDSKFIAAQTVNPGRLQKIKIGDDEMQLKNTFDQERVKTDYSFKEISLEKDDVILAGDGVFAFSQDYFFNPAVKKINNNTEVDKDGINYVLADYRSPEVRGNSKIAIIDFDLNNVYQEKGRYGFLVSVPGLLAEDGMEDGLLIKNIRINLEGKNIIEFIKKKLNRHE